MTNSRILARCVTPGDVLKKRTTKGGTVTFLVTHVEAGEQCVTVYTLREYDGQVANYSQTYPCDEMLTFRRSV